jgi:hypothetical protein
MRSEPERRDSSARKPPQTSKKSLCVMQTNGVESCMLHCTVNRSCVSVGDVVATQYHFKDAGYCRILLAPLERAVCRAVCHAVCHFDRDPESRLSSNRHGTIEMFPQANRESDNILQTECLWNQKGVAWTLCQLVLTTYAHSTVFLNRYGIVWQILASKVLEGKYYVFSAGQNSDNTYDLRMCPPILWSSGPTSQLTPRQQIPARRVSDRQFFMEPESPSGIVNFECYRSIAINFTATRGACHTISAS